MNVENCEFCHDTKIMLKQIRIDAYEEVDCTSCQTVVCECKVIDNE